MKITNFFACLFLSKIIFSPNTAYSMLGNSIFDTGYNAYEGKPRLESTPTITHEAQYAVGFSSLNDQINKSSKPSTTYSRKTHSLNLPRGFFKSSIISYDASYDITTSSISSASYLLNNEGTCKLMSFIFDTLHVDSITWTTEITDNCDTIVSKKIQNNGAFIFYPYLADGVYPLGTTKYTLWKTSQGFTGNKPILDLAVPFAKFMTLTLSEDKKDLILTLTLPNELTV